MDTTRQRILEHISSEQSQTASELSRVLGTSTANIRHHLAVLSKEGAIEIVEQRPGSGRGRPTHIYAITRQTRAHNLDRLADALLQELLSGLQPSEQLPALARIAAHLAEQSPGGSMAQRLTDCVKVLNNMNYQARWEARSSGPRLVLAHCPYAMILGKHPELCQMDNNLLEGMLDTAVSQVARLAPRRQGGRVCVFAASFG